MTSKEAQMKETRLLNEPSSGTYLPRARTPVEQRPIQTSERINHLKNNEPTIEEPDDLVVEYVHEECSPAVVKMMRNALKAWGERNALTLPSHRKNKLFIECERSIF